MKPKGQSRQREVVLDAVTGEVLALANFTRAMCRTNAAICRVNNCA
jgi:cell division protein FtsI/penicillin-binding protein 2